MRLKISTKALDDHTDRLYKYTGDDFKNLEHSDGIESGTIVEIHRTKTITTVEMSNSAIQEFLDDADYQYEIRNEYEENLGMGNIFGRAIISVRKQLKK